MRNRCWTPASLNSAYPALETDRKTRHTYSFCGREFSQPPQRLREAPTALCTSPPRPFAPILMQPTSRLVVGKRGKPVSHDKALSRESAPSPERVSSPEKAQARASG